MAVRGNPEGVGAITRMPFVGDIAGLPPYGRDREFYDEACKNPKPVTPRGRRRAGNTEEYVRNCKETASSIHNKKRRF